MPSGNKPIRESMLTQIHVAIWRHKAIMSQLNKPVSIVYTQLYNLFVYRFEYLPLKLQTPGY